MRKNLFRLGPGNLRSVARGRVVLWCTSAVVTAVLIGRVLAGPVVSVFPVELISIPLISERATLKPLKEVKLWIDSVRNSVADSSKIKTVKR